MSNKAAFLCDFGATHVRLGTLSASGPARMKTYTVADWPDMITVLRDYAGADGDCYRGALFYMAHTGHIREGRLDLGYKKTNPWSFAIEDIRRTFSMEEIICLNDLEACAYAALDSANFAFQTLRASTGAVSPDAVVIGIGTGAGHAFVSRDTGRVRETYGGHFAPLIVTEKQHALAAIVQQSMALDRSFIFEDILSGAGLFRLYTALAQMNGATPRAESVFDLIPLKDKDPLVRESVTMFCEFLGLYAHILCNATYRYGGVYLCGGVVRRLTNAGLFDIDAFVNQFNQDMVPVVAASLLQTPVFVAEDDYTALHGLKVFAQTRKGTERLAS